MSNVFENKGALAKTIVVAASNSLNRGQANYVCDGVNDHVEIQAALDALPATGGEVLLLEGTYYLAVGVSPNSYQTLRGCGHNTILTVTANGQNVINVVSWAGAEKIGMVVTDLCIDCTLGGAIGSRGINWEYVDFSEIRNCRILHSSQIEINLENCDYDVISGNVCSSGFTGIRVASTTASIVMSNRVLNMTDAAMLISQATRCVISNNYLYGSVWGLEITSSSQENIFSGNACIKNQLGILLSASNHNLVIANYITESSFDAHNSSDDIMLHNADYNNIQDNTCRAGSLANKPRYGINISNAGCDSNLVIDNDLYNDGFGTAPFNDAGTGTKLNTYKVPFSHGSDPQDSGFLIDAAAEMARAWLRLPNKVVQVVRAKVYARSGVLEADHMRGEFVIYGGADNEAYNTHDGSVANHPTDSVNFAANDIIFWTIATAGLLAMVGGDSIEVKAIYESAGNGDCATNAYLRTVEIEYV